MRRLEVEERSGGRQAAVGECRRSEGAAEMQLHLENVGGMF